ncbi:MAG: helix-hairpin-helix domain-containing protein [Fusobacteriota bacterium]
MDNDVQYLVYIILLLLVGHLGVKFYKNKENKNLDIQVEKLEFQNDLGQENPNKRFDINLSKKREFEIKGISSNRSEKILNYISEFGAVTDLNNLTHIKGIGPKTLVKIKKNFRVDEDTIKKVGVKKVNINDVDENKLIMMGFEETDIEKLLEWKENNGIIFSNVDMINIFGEKRYDEIKDRIRY